MFFIWLFIALLVCSGRLRAFYKKKSMVITVAFDIVLTIAAAAALDSGVLRHS